MLGKFVRFVAANNTGVTVAIGGLLVKWVGIKVSISGILTYTVLDDAVNNSGTIADGASETGPTIDIGTGGYNAIQLQARIAFPGGATGDVTIYMETSPDGSTWDTLRELIMVVPATASTTKNKSVIR